LRPYFSWLDTQSDDETAAASDNSPASGHLHHIDLSPDISALAFILDCFYQ
jgi:hypothetical protein